MKDLWPKINERERTGSVQRRPDWVGEWPIHVV